MKVCFVISSMGCGGAERVLSLMANYWAEQAWSVSVLTFEATGSKPFYALNSSIDYRPLDLFSESSQPGAGIIENIKRIERLRREFKTIQPDLVISFMDAVNVLSTFAARLAGVPVIVSERTDPSMNPISRAWNALRTLAYSMADRVVVQTERARSFFSSGIQRRTVVIPNPVQTASEANEPEHYGVKRPFIVSVGRLEPEKRFDHLIEAFARIFQNHPAYSLVIAGEGRERERLERLIAELGLNDSVYLIGRVDHPFDLFHGADLFALTSRFEGFPNALCEAMASGCAVVSYDIPSGPREIISDGRDGLLCEAGDIETLAKTIARVIDEPGLRATLGDNAIEAMKRYALDAIMAQWADLARQASGVSAR